MPYILAGMPYKERFEVLDSKEGKNNEIRLVFDKVVNKFGVQNYDEIDYFEEKEDAVKSFNKLGK